MVSVQALNEFAAVARANLRFSRVLCPQVVPLTLEIHDRALGIGERYGYSIFDALMISAAIEAGSDTLFGGHAEPAADRASHGTESVPIAGELDPCGITHTAP